VNEAPAPAAEPPPPVVEPVPVEPIATAPRPFGPAPTAWLVAVLLGVLAIAGLALAWKADQRVRKVEQELVQRQQDSAGQSSEARLLARQAQESVRGAEAKVALLEARVAEVALQRSQLEELMQSLSRSRDENLLVDIEAAIRVALQQAAITGSAEPLVTTLKQSDERLARFNQPRLEGVRRAIARDLDRVKAASVADVATLAIKLDEAIRIVDELPLLAAATPGRAEAARAAAAARTASAGANVSGAAAASGGAGAAAASGAGKTAVTQWAWSLNDATARLVGQAWEEVKSLVRVTRIDHPDAVLMAPEQSFFLKENLKLRLLNARLALLSRQFETAQSDLQAALGALDRYFDRGSRRTALAAELLRQVATQARQGGVPRPDDTLAAVAAAEAGR
jgi:uroporphyrin-3 C-methyltransferase